MLLRPMQGSIAIWENVIAGEVLGWLGLHAETISWNREQHCDRNVVADLAGIFRSGGIACRSPSQIGLHVEVPGVRVEVPWDCV